MAIRVPEETMKYFEDINTEFRWSAVLMPDEQCKALGLDGGQKEVCIATFKPTGEVYCRGYGHDKASAMADLLVRLKTCPKPMSAAEASVVLSIKDEEIRQLKADKERLESLATGNQRSGTKPIQMAGT